MKNVALFDLNNLAIRTFFVNDVGGHTVNPDFKLWKYMTFNSIYQSMFRIENLSEIIVAVDDRHSWRKMYFPRYKESRKPTRDKSDVDWDSFYAELSSFVEELRTHIPFKVIGVQSAEADDVIGILTLNKKEDDDYFIISNDEDFLQLCSNKVKIYNPSKQTYMECNDIEEFIVLKSLTGQSKDDIFNIKTPLDWGLTEETKGKRKPGFGVKSAEKVIKNGYEKWIKENKLEERFELNRNLIDFKKIPNTIKARVLGVYNGYKMADVENIYKFFKNNEFRGFLDEFEKVENMLLKLY